MKKSCGISEVLRTAEWRPWRGNRLPGHRTLIPEFCGAAGFGEAIVAGMRLSRSFALPKLAAADCRVSLRETYRITPRAPPPAPPGGRESRRAVPLPPGPMRSLSLNHRDTERSRRAATLRGLCDLCGSKKSPAAQQELRPPDTATIFDFFFIQF